MFKCLGKGLRADIDVAPTYRAVFNPEYSMWALQVCNKHRGDYELWSHVHFYATKERAQEHLNLTTIILHPNEEEEHTNDV